MRLGCNPGLAGVKHLNRLEQVLARAEWDDPSIVEGLMRDADGHVVEGTMSNLFAVLDGVLLTPELSLCGVRGIMREIVLETAARCGLAPVERKIPTEALLRADEVFLTNSLIGVWPVRRFESEEFPVGDVTRRLMGALEETAGV